MDSLQIYKFLISFCINLERLYTNKFKDTISPDDTLNFILRWLVWKLKIKNEYLIVY